MKNLSSIIRASSLGVLAGGAVGLTIGLLIAPDEGQKVRRRLMYQLENVTLRAGLFLEELMRSETQGEARRTGDALVEDAEVRARLIREEIDALLEEMQR